MQRLKTVMLLLIANGSPLGAEWQDHPPTASGARTANALLVVIFCYLPGRWQGAQRDRNRRPCRPRTLIVSNECRPNLL